MLIKDPYALTPMFPESSGNELRTLILQLKEEVGKLSASMHPITAGTVAELVITMNSYYSNLIEGQYTHPLDIEKALKKDYSEDEQKRLLQKESVAHIEVNKAMRAELLKGNTAICSTPFLCRLHDGFYKLLPAEFHTVKANENDTWQVVPGKLRAKEVRVGTHECPAAEALPKMMDFFETHYAPENIKDPVQRILAIAASHHRLAFIHPFLDGNGRVIRLFSEAYLISEGLDANGLWSISRGLAVYKKDYYARLKNADLMRLNDYDGRGNLSDRYLAEFCLFFLNTAIDQVKFMSSLFEIDGMLNRLEKFTEIMATRNQLRPESALVLRDVFLRGKITKGEVQHIINRSEPVATELTKTLLAEGLLKTEDYHRAPLTMGFPIRYAPYLFPKLFPPQVEAEMIA